MSGLNQIPHTKEGEKQVGSLYIQEEAVPTRKQPCLPHALPPATVRRLEEHPLTSHI